MSGGPVDPADVPVFTGDLHVLEAKTKALSRGGSKVQTAGADVHKSFGGLAAFYKAPEAEQLFGVTKPVERTAHDLSHDMHVIAKALGTYAGEIRPLIHRLEQLKKEAANFRDKEAAEDDWSEDGDLVEENLNRRNKIAEVWAAFQEAERDCHAKIVALVHGHALHTIDASHKNGYGYDAEALKASKSLPWGEAVEESIPAWQVWEHAYEFGKGFIVDGVGGTIDGIYTLFGGHGSEAAGAAWTGLAKLSTAFTITALPIVGQTYWMLPGKMLPSWLRDSRTAVLDTGKALVAWDQWESNGSRAAGAVTFNVVTAVFTRGGGAAVEGAGKAGALAKGLSVVSKVGSAVDPMTYVIKGAGAGLSKVGDVMAHLKGLGHVEAPKISDGAYSLPEGAAKMPDGTIQLPEGAAVPEGATKLPNGRIKLPEGTVDLPSNTVKDPATGKYMSGRGDLYNEDGSLFQRAEDAPKDNPAPPATGAEHPRIETPAHQEQRVPAGVGGRGDDFTRVGSEISDPARAGDNAGHGSTKPGDNTPMGRAGDDGAPRGNAGNHMPTNSHTEPSPSGGAHASDATPTGPEHSSGDGQGVPHQGDHGGQSGSHDGPSSSDVHSGSGGSSGSGGAGQTGLGDEGLQAPAEHVPGGASESMMPMERGGELEQRLREAIKGLPGATRPKPNVLELALSRLAENPRGHAVADIIASGRFNRSGDFSQVVSSLGSRKIGMVEPGVDQIIFADDLCKSGVPAESMNFEVKNAAGGDIDVHVRADNGEVYGYQMKRLNEPLDPVGEIMRGKYLGQLAKSDVDHRIMLVDGQGSVAQWMENGSFQALMDVHRAGRNGNGLGAGTTFVIRLDDGSLVVPPGAKTDPKDML
ncbi:hypothetical protein AB0C96_09255 [Streptomyces sp. NPDC048506]|uniref:hypothetical protein n=1 Tax=Streptomyces sp. NPDC048506 TaxID=3155028 RepID=UPI003447AD88